jgi:hypothetical protein
MVYTRNMFQEWSFSLLWTPSIRTSAFLVRGGSVMRTILFVIVSIHFLFHSHRLSDTHLTLIAHQTARSRNPQQTLCFIDHSYTMRRMNEPAHRSSECQSGNLNVGAGNYYKIYSDYNHVFIAPPLTNYFQLQVLSI